MATAKERTKIFKVKAKDISGFTIAELLVAATCAAIIIPAAFGLVFTLAQQDQNLIRKNLQKEEMNRALSFLQAEGRSATRVSTFRKDRSEIYELDWRAEGESPIPTLVSQNTTVACLKPPHYPLFKFYLSKTPVPVYYSIRTLDSSISPLWIRPSAIYRCGPALNADGTYGSDNTDTPTILLDGISGPAPTNCIPDLKIQPNTCNPDNIPGMVFRSICEDNEKNPRSYPDHHPPEVRNLWPNGTPGNSHQELAGGVRVCVAKAQNGIAIQINRLTSPADGIPISIQLETYTAMRSLP